MYEAIDDRIASLGFSISENSEGGTYIKPVLNEDGRLVYNHRIDILKRGKEGVGIGSYEAGGGDTKDLGPASVVLSFDEIEAFYKKAKKFKRKWWFERRIKMIKSAVFGVFKKSERIQNE